MSNLPSYRRIFEQDYPDEYKELVKQLSVSINYGFDPLYELLNGKLTLTDNLDTTIKTISVEVDAAGKPKNKVTIKKSNSNKSQGLMVIKAVNITNTNVFPNAGVLISYTETTDSIIINHVAGLPANNIFDLTIVAIR